MANKKNNKNFKPKPKSKKNVDLTDKPEDGENGALIKFLQT